ncbi:MAG: NAD(P)H-dependent glycerol-3-phosphate dehydrogenase [Alphaproteobacteria bacterium]
MQKVSVIGAGAWGTALAATAAAAGRNVQIWALEPDVVSAINTAHENSVYLKDVPLDPGITATTDLKAAVQDAELILMVTPAQHMRTVLAQMAAGRGGIPLPPLVLCAKGIEIATGKLLTDVVAEEAPGAPVAVLSGPTFAAEVAKGLPTAVTLSCADDELAAQITDAIGRPAFRPYAASDVVGAEVGGAIKNVFAIACGMVEGKGLGDNARAALTARGMAEMMRLGEALGGKRETLMGLSGIGDLILTCTSTQSRNYSLGVALGQGQSMAAIMGARNTVAEGVHTAKAVAALADRLGIDMPITKAVNAVVSESAAIDDEIIRLLSRPFTQEGR